LGGLGSCGTEIVGGQIAMAAVDVPSQYCGRCIEISLGGKTTRATVADTCPECASGDLDVTQDVFSQLTSLGVGRIRMDWTFCDATPAPIPSASLPPPESQPTSVIQPPLSAPDPEMTVNVASWNATTARWKRPNGKWKKLKGKKRPHWQKIKKPHGWKHHDKRDVITDEWTTDWFTTEAVTTSALNLEAPPSTVSPVSLIVVSATEPALPTSAMDEDMSLTTMEESAEATESSVSPSSTFTHRETTVEMQGTPLPLLDEGIKSNGFALLVSAAWLVALV